MTNLFISAPRMLFMLFRNMFWFQLLCDVSVSTRPPYRHRVKSKVGSETIMGVSDGVGFPKSHLIGSHCQRIMVCNLPWGENYIPVQKMI